jgi:predicted dehydrogenase
MHRNTNALSRRQFLASTAALAAGGPLILSSGCASGPKPRAANDRITLGFIGTGRIAQSHLKGFLGRGDVQIVAVNDVDTNRREHAQKQVEQHYAKAAPSGSFKGCTAYRDFRELLARREIDAVVVCTPDHWHALQSIDAAKNGKDIYCEKPLSLTVREAREMAKATRRYSRVFQTGSQQRSSKEFRTAAELVRNGVIGRLQTVRAALGPSSKWCDLPEEPMEPGLDWDFWLGPAPLRPYNAILSPRGVHEHFPKWRDYREYSGGMVTDWGAHHFDIAQWALGMDESGPVEIIPPADPKATHGLKFVYANGVEMIHDDGNGLNFLGTEGRIHVNRGKFELWLGGEQKAATPKDCDRIAEEYLRDAKVRLYVSTDHRADWLECIRTRKRPICDVEVGARSVSVCHLANIAYWNRRALKWDPKKEQFPGDAAANKDLDRDQRGPWRI